MRNEKEWCRTFFMIKYLGDCPTGVRPEQDEVGKDSARQFQPEEMELV